VSTLATNLRSGIPHLHVPVSISPDATSFVVSSATIPTPDTANARCVKPVVGSAKVTTVLMVAVEVYIRSVAKAGVLVVVNTDKSKRPKPPDTPS